MVHGLKERRAREDMIYYKKSRESVINWWREDDFSEFLQPTFCVVLQHLLLVVLVAEFLDILTNQL